MPRNMELDPTIDLVFGLQLFLETFKSFLWTTKSADDVQKSVDAPMKLLTDLFESGNPVNSNACKILLAQSSMLHEYQQEIRFDLYYQSPWVAGSHMAECLHWAMYGGLQLCNNERLMPIPSFPIQRVYPIMKAQATKDGINLQISADNDLNYKHPAA
ncbi:hypothetical protein NHQ30_010796 [Ciborinia camelliae]|nr:hypothetical protein NHQ30_010796 [Ciborinia camelliae]